jgi:hypothetical protein
MRPVFRGVLLSALVISAQAGPARAVSHGDWPCVQVRVPELSVAAFWSGPPLDEATATWRGRPEIAGIVAQVVSRRVAVEDAEKRIADFAASHKGDKAGLAQVFAGAFSELNTLRSRIVRGIERFTRSQRQLSESINKDRAELSTLGAAPEKTEQQRARIQELQTKIQWATRLHHERESTLRYVCETPVILEQRVFSIARAVQNEM